MRRGDGTGKKRERSFFRDALSVMRKWGGGHCLGFSVPIFRSLFHDYIRRIRPNGTVESFLDGLRSAWQRRG